jgi:hypothetical protein
VWVFVNFVNIIFRIVMQKIKTKYLFKIMRERERKREVEVFF